jgi:hypothetical protein
MEVIIMLWLIITSVRVWRLMHDEDKYIDTITKIKF